MEEPAALPAPSTWLIRIPEVFTAWEPDIIRSLGAEVLKKARRDYHLVRIADPMLIHDSQAAKFACWNLPVHHSWPCRPDAIPGFIEKAAQALFWKFGNHTLQTLMAGPLEPGSSNRYYHTLASNLRGRALQLFPPAFRTIHDAECQDSRLPTLFCLVGKEGLFCGIQSPKDSNGFHPGGTKFIRQNTPDTISRAGAKIAEALHYLQLHRQPPSTGSHWLELGASPGGMTAELLGRGYRVTAVDRAPLDPRLQNAPGLKTAISDASNYQPPPDCRYDAILSDMNGDALESIAHVTRLARFLAPCGLVVFTLKLPGVATFSEVNSMESRVLDTAAKAGLQLLASTHLTYNRQEFTLFFNHTPSPPRHM